MLILITGVPGTGKTTVAQILCKLIGAEEIDLLELARERKLLTGYDPDAGSMVVDETKISNAVSKMIKKDKKYVIASHLAHFVSPKISKICVVLRCNPLVLEKRLQKRGYLKGKVHDNMMCEYLDCCLIEALKVGHKRHLHEIDTTKMKPRQVVQEILNVLNRKKKHSFGDVKWLV
jgi:adenylate kinase